MREADLHRTDLVSTIMTFRRWSLGRRGETWIGLDKSVRQGLQSSPEERPLLILAIPTSRKDELLDIPIDMFSQGIPFVQRGDGNSELTNGLGPRIRKPKNSMSQP